MRLHQIISSDGGNRPRKRVGRGEGGGRGKTSGRGHKGQRARSGSSLRPGFESGHIPLYRRLPKRGFNNARFRTSVGAINVGDLARLSGDEVNRETLIQAGLLDSRDTIVKILGNGEVERPLQLTVDRISAGARQKIEQAGGSVTLLNAPAPAETSSEAES